jgi:ribA/ribD-fused uncharacterized protein
MNQDDAAAGGEQFTLFWHGPFSQWHPCKFTVSRVEFNCAEQFMMYSKAILFGDMQSAQRILETSTPKEQKTLGRKVQNFDEAVWAIFREGIVYTASYAKFTQNFELQEMLLATKGTTLVEASPRDRIWGIGLGADNPKAQVRAEWRGRNLLGETLTRVREAILWEKAR